MDDDIEGYVPADEAFIKQGVRDYIETQIDLEESAPVADQDGVDSLISAARNLGWILRGQLIYRFLDWMQSNCSEEMYYRALAAFAEYFPVLTGGHGRRGLRAAMEHELYRRGICTSMCGPFMAALPETTREQAVGSLQNSSGIEPGNVDAEFEEVVDEDPMSLYDMPLWFDPYPIKDEEPPTTGVSIYGMFMADYLALNEAHNWVTDLLNLIGSLHRIAFRLLELIQDEEDVFSYPNRQIAIDYVKEAMNRLKDMLLPNDGNLRVQGPPILCQGSDVAESWVQQAASCLSSAERYVETRETRWLQQDDVESTFKAYASRYERARYRYFLAWMLSSFKIPNLKLTTLSSTDQLEPLVRPYNEEKQCPICCEEFPCPGNVGPPIVVAHKCCRKPFHADCLLTWLFEKLPDEELQCVMCRTPLDLEFLGEVMDARVLSMKVL